MNASIWRFVRRQQPSIVPLTGGGGPAFYCVHPIAGDVTSYLDLAQLLQPTVRTFGIQVPSEKMEAEYGRSIVEIAKRYVDELTTIQPSGPVFLGGWSIGAIIALEMAQQLKAIGRQVPLLVALDGAPCNTGVEERSKRLRLLLRSMRDVSFHIREAKRTGSYRRLFSRAMARVLGRHLSPLSVSGSHQTLDSGTVETLLGSKPWSDQHASFIRALYQATMMYEPQYYGGRVLALEARVQPFMRERRIGPSWRAIAEAVDIVEINCSHATLLQKPIIEAVSSKISDHLSKFAVPAFCTF